MSLNATFICQLLRTLLNRGVAKISAWKSNIQQKITQQRLLKIFRKAYIKFAQNLKIFQNFSKINLCKI